MVPQSHCMQSQGVRTEGEEKARSDSRAGFREGQGPTKCFSFWLKGCCPDCAQCSPPLPIAHAFGVGETSLKLLCLETVPHPSVCCSLLPASVLWLELYEAEDNVGLISVPGRHVTCASGTQTARVLTANSSRERTEGLSHLITGNGSLCVCDSVRLSDRF